MGFKGVTLIAEHYGRCTEAVDLLNQQRLLRGLGDLVMTPKPFGDTPLPSLCAYNQAINVGISDDEGVVDQDSLVELRRMMQVVRVSEERGMVNAHIPTDWRP